MCSDELGEPCVDCYRKSGGDVNDKSQPLSNEQILEFFWEMSFRAETAEDRKRAIFQYNLLADSMK